MNLQEAVYYHERLAEYHLERAKDSLSELNCIRHRETAKILQNEATRLRREMLWEN